MLDRKTVIHVARLARLKLSEGEIDKMNEQLSAVLAHFEQLASVNTDGVAPMITPTVFAAELGSSHFRSDQAIASSSSPDQLLQNAPEKNGRLFRVPPVV